jgi:hypothetical protein
LEIIRDFSVRAELVEALLGFSAESTSKQAPKRQTPQTIEREREALELEALP